MSLAVLFIGTASMATLRAVPHGLEHTTCSAAESREAARNSQADRLLIVEAGTHLPSSSFVSAQNIDARGGLVGGCSVDGSMLRFGSVFAQVSFGPYDMDPFALVDLSGGAQRERPDPEGIDTIAPGAFIVDRAAFVELGGLDPILGSPWRAYDISLRFRDAGKMVRYERTLTFVHESALATPTEAADRREFMQRWNARLTAHFDLDMPARGGVRRAVRLPMGQRDAAAQAVPPVDIILYGDGTLSPNSVRLSTRVRLAAIRDGRADESEAVGLLRNALQTRSDRYIVLLRADAQLDSRWLERMIVEVESTANMCGVSEPGRTLLSLSKIPLDVQPAPDLSHMDPAIKQVLEGAQRRSRIVRGNTPQSIVRSEARVPVSVILVAQSNAEFGKTSFEGTYAGDLGVEYLAVGTPTRSGMLDWLKGYPTIDLIVDDSKNLGVGLNIALARAKGDIVVVMGDEFFPPRDWITMVRDSFAIRPETGILGFSSVSVEGPQAVDTGYNDIKAYHVYAGSRRETMRREVHLAPRLSALIFALDARALRSVGGFDERLGGGRWGIEDLTLRIRAAGYEAYVAEDVFTHRFPPELSNPYLNEPAEEATRGAIFADKWGLRPAEIVGFNAAPLVARGFDPTRDFVPLRHAADEQAGLRDNYDAVFVAACETEADLQTVAAALRRYFQAFRSGDAVLFAIGVSADLDVEAVSGRARAIARKSGVDLDQTADVVIAPYGEELEKWVASLAAGPRHCVHGGDLLTSVSRLEDLSPSGFRRARESVLT
jgi:GT2 family glycosyltransferase